MESPTVKQSIRKPKVLFVGGFSPPTDGTKGGQLAACLALKDSAIQDLVEWQLIDSTQLSHPPPPLKTRAWNATKRVVLFTRCALSSGSSSALIFTSYDLLSFAEKGLMCLIAFAARKRVVLSIRSEVRPRASFRFYFPYQYTVFRCCHAVICQSDTAARALQAQFGDRIATTVIPNWIDATAYRPPAGTGNEKATESPTVGFVFCGWLEKQKGIFELIQAADELKRRGLKFRVTLCGGGREKQALEEKIAELNLTEVVCLAGWVDSTNLKKMLGDADVFVLPSYTEGLPNAVLEAMATGLPVISTPVGGIPSIIEDGRNGLLVAPTDVRALANAMHKLATDQELRSQMGQSSLKRIEEKHDINQAWKQVARALAVV